MLTMSPSDKNLNPELQEILEEARRVLAKGCVLKAEASLPR
jgi:hypothetical protein